MSELKFAVYSFLCFALMIGKAAGETRWCQVSNRSSSLEGDGWLQYDDMRQACVNCSSQSVTLIDVDLLGNHECCDGSLVAIGNCDFAEEGSGSTCSAGVECDGTKQCVDGSDELGCRDCNETTFACLTHSDTEPCLSRNQVCDSQKDCEMGLDETGCEWHGGWCDGFLCGAPHPRCIPLSQVCDGTKQCINGEDEFNCRYCLKQFRCLVYNREAVGTDTRTADCVGKFRVCDGRADCSNGLDESNCFRWKEWSEWGECNPPSVCERSRQRVCISGENSNVVDPVFCYDVEDYHSTDGNPPVESQTELCPLCIPTRAQTTTLATSRTNFQSITTTTPVTTEATTYSTTGASTQSTTHRTTRVSTEATTHRSTASTPGPTTYRSTVETTEPTTSPTTKIITKATTHRSTAPTTVPTTYQDTDTSHESTTDTNLEKTTAEVFTTLSPTPGQATDAESTSLYSGYSNATVFTVLSTSIGDVITDVYQGNVTSKPEPRGASIVSFTLIVSASVVAGIILILILFCLVFCCTEQRRKTGKWTPRRRYHKDRPVTVPQLYHDVPVDGAGEEDKRLPTELETAQPQTLSSFSGGTLASGADSGIDDVNSTTSSVDRAHRSRHLSHPTSASSSSQISLPPSSSDDFPPPPLNFV